MTKAELKVFEHQLRELISSDEAQRPFVCEGNPLSCRVFIVGSNAATDMGTPFWSFWRTDYGFDKTAWLEAYEKTRLSAGKRALSNSRQRLNRIENVAAPLRILETNVFSSPTASERELMKTGKSTRIFEFLYEKIKPVAIISHGKLAMRELSRLNIACDPRSGRHLRFWKYEEADELGRDLAQRYGGLSP